MVYFKRTSCPEVPRTTTGSVRQVSQLPNRCECYFKKMYWATEQARQCTKNVTHLKSCWSPVQHIRSLTSSPTTTSPSALIHSPPELFITSGFERLLNAAICCGGVAYRLRPSDCKHDCNVCDTWSLESSISWTSSFVWKWYITKYLVQLTTWSTFILKTLTVVKLVHKFSAFYKTWRFITVYKEDLSWVSWTEHTSSLSLGIHFNVFLLTTTCFPTCLFVMVSQL